jgi:microcystin-dependent protein
MDDMGAPTASRLTPGGFGVSATTLGNVGGSEQHTLSLGEMPSHIHGVNDFTHAHSWGGTFATGGMNPGAINPHSHTFPDNYFVAANNGIGGTNTVGGFSSTLTGTTDPVDINHSHNVAVGGGTSAQTSNISIQANGFNAAHAIVAPTMVMTIYIKL